MNAKIGVLILLFVSFKNALTQGSLNCGYVPRSGIYFCDLSIDNPNGFDNFTEISGNHVASYFNKDVTEVSAVTGSNSTNIPSIICEIFINVKTVTLPYIGLEKIGENAFKGCTKIEKISLNDNLIKEVNALAFDNNLELGSLTLESNQLVTLPEALFTNQLKLKFLNVGKNKISDMPNRIFESLKNLTYLDLSRNEIVNPKAQWFKELENVQRLMLNNNQIVELPTNVFSSLQLLVYLTLASNKINIIESKSFGSLPILTSVDLQQNNITAIDKQFIDNVGVTFLVANLNFCVNKTIDDSSQQREMMKTELKNCFENFESLNSTTQSPPSTTPSDATGIIMTKCVLFITFLVNLLLI